MIEVECVNYEPAFSFDEREIKTLFSLLNEHPMFPNNQGNLDIAFLDAERCNDLHKRFFNDPSTTDVMTFPGEEDDHFGDIAVCPLIAKQNALDNQMSFAEECLLYLIHGWLHLNGLNDHAPDEIRAMRKGESILMNYIREHSAIPTMDWNPIH